MNEKQSWNIIAVFLLLIFGLTIATFLHREQSFSERENRALTTKPKMSLETLLNGKFEEDYEDYLTDQFVLRDQWIRLKTGVERLTGKQEVHDVYFAADDYLIEKHTNTFTEKTAENNVKLLGRFAEKISTEYPEIQFKAMIVPNAVDILRDKLPAAASPYDEEVYLDAIRNSLSSEIWIDASSVLSAHADEEIYYKTDHHWETLGAFYAWQLYADETGLGQIAYDDYKVTQVADDFEGTIAAKVGSEVVPDTIEKMESQNGSHYTLTYNESDDIRSTVYQSYALESRDKYAYFYGGNYAMIQAKTTADTNRRILVIKDSYAHCFMPFLYDYFSQADMVDLRYYNNSLNDLIEQNDYTDILFLYNASGFAEDTSLAKLLT